ncbi:MAG: hypothetical protein ACT4O2_07085 [Beijerinckiaceae bacterium]
MSNTLSKSNPYLRSAAQRKRGQWIAAQSSSAVEGIRAPFSAGPDALRPTTTEELIAHVKRRMTKRGG